LDLLTDAGRSVGDIAAHFEMRRPAISQHLRILLDAGLVTEQRHGRERRYRLVPEELAELYGWLSHYERFWKSKIQSLTEQLSAAPAVPEQPVVADLAVQDLEE